MKTAISLPDPLFDAAEKLAERMQLSRSALYARALAEFIDRNSEGDVTAEIDRVLNDVGRRRDPFNREAARATFKRTGQSE